MSVPGPERSPAISCSRMISLKSAEDIGIFVSAQRALSEALDVVSKLHLPDCWIAAGVIRNAVWDLLHNRPFRIAAGDVDVVYFDALASDRGRDQEIEAACRTAMPSLDWSVKNQARMHIGNGDPPYNDTSDAMMHWPETVTAIGARLRNGQVEILAPFGVDDLTALRVRPTPAFRDKLDIYRERVSRKQWKQKWPNLAIFDGIDDLGV